MLNPTDGLPWRKRAVITMQVYGVRLLQGRFRPFGKRAGTLLCGLSLLAGVQLVTPPSAGAIIECAPVPSGGGESMVAFSQVEPSSCSVTDGMYTLPFRTLRLDSIATAYGQCQTMVPSIVNGQWACIPSTVYERLIGRTAVSVDMTTQYFNGSSELGTVYGVGANGATAFFHVLDSTQTNTTGPVRFTTFWAGDYLIKSQASINPTMCNIQPNVTPIYKTRVYVRTTLHRGGSCSNGSLIGATKLPRTGIGYYQFPGTDAVDTDNWGGAESSNRLIQTVGTQWAQNHPSPRFGYNDISRQNGGEFRNQQSNILEHECHQNGLDIDVRYVGKELTPGNNYEDAIDLMNTYDLTNLYDRSRTIELLNLFAANGSLYRIIVDPNAGISSADVLNARIDIDTTGKHRHHFHVSLNDPDGPDTNNCP